MKHEGINQSLVGTCLYNVQEEEISLTGTTLISLLFTKETHLESLHMGFFCK